MHKTQQTRHQSEFAEDEIRSESALAKTHNECSFKCITTFPWLLADHQPLYSFQKPPSPSPTLSVLFIFSFSQLYFSLFLLNQQYFFFLSLSALFFLTSYFLLLLSLLTSFLTCPLAQFLLFTESFCSTFLNSIFLPLCCFCLPLSSMEAVFKPSLQSQSQPFFHPL